MGSLMDEQHWEPTVERLQQRIAELEGEQDRLHKAMAVQMEATKKWRNRCASKRYTAKKRLDELEALRAERKRLEQMLHDDAESLYSVCDSCNRYFHWDDMQYCPEGDAQCNECSKQAEQSKG